MGQRTYEKDLHWDSSQIQGPILVPLNIRRRNKIKCNQKGPIILRTTHRLHARKVVGSW